MTICDYTRHKGHLMDQVLGNPEPLTTTALVVATKLHSAPLNGVHRLNNNRKQAKGRFTSNKQGKEQGQKK